jgi:N-acetylglutamate synthase-like GNAT family acetyltransferase
MVEFIESNIDKETDYKILVELNCEYLKWAGKELKSNYGIDYFPVDEDYNTAVMNYAKSFVNELKDYISPKGVFYIIKEGEKVIGMGGFKKSRNDICEIKRMYIRPIYRRKGIGRNLLTKLVDAAKELDYSKIRLDSTRFMKNAHHLYKSFGFIEIEPYGESEIPEKIRKYWIFMEKRLLEP